jgi:hypothetical protein
MKIRLVRGVVTPLSLLLNAVFAGAQDPSQSALPNRANCRQLRQTAAEPWAQPGPDRCASAVCLPRERLHHLPQPRFRDICPATQRQWVSTAESAVVRMDLLGANLENHNSAAGLDESDV